MIATANDKIKDYKLYYKKITMCQLSFLIKILPNKSCENPCEGTTKEQRWVAFNLQDINLNNNK